MLHAELCRWMRPGHEGGRGSRARRWNAHRAVWAGPCRGISDLDIMIDLVGFAATFALRWRNAMFCRGATGALRMTRCVGRNTSSLDWNGMCGRWSGWLKRLHARFGEVLDT